MDTPTALFEPEHGSLVVIATPPPSTVGFPADKRLVRLDVAFQHFEAVGRELSRRSN
jgi:hypothetical protein